MFPPQTSLIPVTVAIARFLEVNGLASFFGHYPYWYLGVPARYLAGPIVPTVLLITHNLVSDISLFSISIYLIGLSFLAAAIGWTWLVKKITKNQLPITIYYLLFTLLIILPWRYLSALALREASATIAKNLLPFALLVFWTALGKKKGSSMVAAITAGALLLLINTSVFPILLVGSVGLIIAKSFRKGKFKGVVSNTKKIFLITIYSLLIATFWYTPGYWWTAITNPSIAGAAGYKVFLRIFDLLRASVPLVLAIVAVYFSGKIKSRISIFTLVWTLTFGFLTLFRFIGDPDFWQDWSAWFSELEIGVALLIVKLVNRKSATVKRIANYQLRFTISGLLLLTATILLTYHVYGLLHKPPLISKEIPQGVRSLEKLDEIISKEEKSLPREASSEVRVFLSGSTVFWANALYDLNQVRGGVDRAAVHPYWDHAAFQLREGASPELATQWLEALGVSYVLVHGPLSSEAYHDFRNIEKWDAVGEIVWEEAGDAIVKVPDSSLAWVVDETEIENVESPDSGADSAALSSYFAAKKRSVEVNLVGPNKLFLEAKELKEGEAVVLAISFDTSWKTEDDVSLKKDPFGNILIMDIKTTSIGLEFKRF